MKSIHFKAALVSVLLLLAFLGIWYVATFSSGSAAGSTAGLTAEQMAWRRAKIVELKGQPKDHEYADKLRRLSLGRIVDMLGSPLRTIPPELRGHRRRRGTQSHRHRPVRTHAGEPDLAARTPLISGIAGTPAQDTEHRAKITRRTELPLDHDRPHIRAYNRYNCPRCS